MYWFRTVSRSFLLVLIILISGFESQLCSQSTVTQVAIGAQGDDNVGTILATAFGYTFGGNTSSYGSGVRDALFFATDASGQPLWSLAFGGGGDESITGQCHLPDGGYALAGRTSSYGVGDTEIFFARLSSTGELLHFKTYGGIPSDRSMGMIPTMDGQFLIFGASYGGSLGGQDILLLKVTEYGDLIWSRAYGGSVSEVCYSVKETAEGEFIVFAYGDSWNSPTDFNILKIDPKGDLIWDKAYGGSNFEMLSGKDAGLIASTGDIYLLGATNSYGMGDYDQLLIKLNAGGDLLWSRTIGGPHYDYGRSLMETSAGEILACGFITRNGYRDGLVSKFTPTGDCSWSIPFGLEQVDDIYSVLEIPGDSLLMLGVTESMGSGGADVWLIRTDADLNTECNVSDFEATVLPQLLTSRPSGANRGIFKCEISEIDVSIINVDPNATLQVDTLCTVDIINDVVSGQLPQQLKLEPNSPNPFNPETTIRFELPDPSLITLAVYNLKGQLITSLIANEQMSAGKHVRIWNGQDSGGRGVASGVYICRLQSNEHILEREMLLIK